MSSVFLLRLRWHWQRPRAGEGDSARPSFLSRFGLCVGGLITRHEDEQGQLPGGDSPEQKVPKCDTAYREMGCFGLREIAAAGCKASGGFLQSSRCPQTVD